MIAYDCGQHLDILSFEGHMAAVALHGARSFLERLKLCAFCAQIRINLSTKEQKCNTFRENEAESASPKRPLGCDNKSARAQLRKLAILSSRRWKRGAEAALPSAVWNCARSSN